MLLTLQVSAKAAIIILLFLQIIDVAGTTIRLSLIDDEKEQNSPAPRWGTDCVLNPGYLYCYGGIIERNYLDDGATFYEETPTNTMYRLSLYEPWSVDEPLWEEIRSNDAAVVSLGYFAAANLPDGNRFLIHGGQGDQMKTTGDTLVYDAYRNEWTKPQVIGAPPAQRIRHSATSDNQGRVWIWGGKSDLRSNTVVYDNRWTVIDTNTWTYNYPDIPNPPSPRVDHTATLTPNGDIIIIGGLVYSRNVTDPLGQHSLNPVSMNSLLKFDAAASHWQNVTAIGNIPAPRGGHSAVLSSDGSSIIVFGGSTIEEEGKLKTLNDIFVLELATMRWSAPSVYGEPPLPRKYHFALLVDEDLMLVGFGLGSDKERHSISNIHLLSTSAWTWISEYHPNVYWLTRNGTTNMVTTASDMDSNTTLLDSPTRTTNTPSFPPYINTDNGVVVDNTGSPAQEQVTLSEKHDESKNEQRSHVRAGVIAGVISGGVVAVIGGVIVALSVVFLRHRRDAYEEDNTEKTPDNSFISPNNNNRISIANSELLIGQKPDCRSSLYHATQIDTHERKPDEP